VAAPAPGGACAATAEARLPARAPPAGVGGAAQRAAISGAVAAGAAAADGGGAGGRDARRKGARSASAGKAQVFSRPPRRAAPPCRPAAEANWRAAASCSSMGADRAAGGARGARAVRRSSRLSSGARCACLERSARRLPCSAPGVRDTSGRRAT